MFYRYLAENKGKRTVERFSMFYDTEAECYESRIYFAVHFKLINDQFANGSVFKLVLMDVIP